jgi:hypothetical protein
MGSLTIIILVGGPLRSNESASYASNHIFEAGIWELLVSSLSCHSFF